MRFFTAADGTQIAYDEWGRETADPALPPVVLHHGFIADANLNWVGPGVVNALVNAGRHVVALDARGHGASGKPHDASFYGEGKMAGDLRQLFDIIGAPQVDLAGYSMGSIVSLVVASQDARVRRLVVGGVGAGVTQPGAVNSRLLSRDAIVAALLAENPESVTEPTAALFRRFADRVGGDRQALAAHLRRPAHRRHPARADYRADTGDRGDGGSVSGASRGAGERDSSRDTEADPRRPPGGSAPAGVRDGDR